MFIVSISQTDSTAITFGASSSLLPVSDVEVLWKRNISLSQSQMQVSALTRKLGNKEINLTCLLSLSKACDITHNQVIVTV